MIKIDDNTSVDLDVLAESHYDNLIGSLLAGGENYHSRSSLIQRIKNRRKIDAAIPNQQRVDFWDYLLLNKFINLKRIIISRPDILKNIISEIELICGVGFFSTDINYNEAELTDFGKIVKKNEILRIFFDFLKCISRKKQQQNNCNQLVIKQNSHEKNSTYFSYCAIDKHLICTRQTFRNFRICRCILQI